MGGYDGDYARIERAIRYLEETARAQPRLADVARHVGLSEYHFQRLFRRWAGVSPKRFLQFLTAEHAKRLLDSSRSLLDVTYEAGLSSPSRLHELFVSVHAMTPAEFRSRGAGILIRFGFQPSPFGDCLVAATDRGICALSFVEPGERSEALAGLRRSWPGADFEEDSQVVGHFVGRIFSSPGAPCGKALPLHLLGTNFQLRVWEALLRIPPGGATTYGDLAEAIGTPGGARAVGSAVGNNPIAYLIPCHRVIRSTGAFGDYRWGSARKQAILGWEAACLGQGAGR